MTSLSFPLTHAQWNIADLVPVGAELAGAARMWTDGQYCIVSLAKARIWEQRDAGARRRYTLPLLSLTAISFVASLRHHHGP
jgi:hypothetical protein